jgi:uncharacterized protein
VNLDRRVLRLNVGFIVNQTIGYVREIPLEFPALNLDPDLELTDVAGAARITRTPQGLLVQVKMAAYTTAECVRCLTEFQQPLAIDFTELYAFSNRTVTESGLLLPEDGHIDLAPLVRDEMLLEIPINPLCRPDCQGLCPVCGERLTGQPHKHEVDNIDPRLAKLKELLDQRSTALKDNPRGPAQPIR